MKLLTSRQDTTLSTFRRSSMIPRDGVFPLLAVVSGSTITAKGAIDLSVRAGLASGNAAPPKRRMEDKGL